jgi:hypothetical protein
MKNDRPRSIYDLSRNALITQLAEWKEPAYRADQIRRWMYQRCVTSFDEMTDLSKSLRAQLQASFILGQFVFIFLLIIPRSRSALDRWLDAQMVAAWRYRR